MHAVNETTPEMLEDAIALAVKSHRGQLDRAGKPYITHPLRMMARASSLDEAIVAVLHDVVEDTPVTFADLARMGLPEHVTEAVEALTRRKALLREKLGLPPGDDEPYDDFVERTAAVALAREVKLLDLRDNMDIMRLEIIGIDDLERLNRYLRAWGRLNRGTHEHEDI